MKCKICQTETVVAARKWVSVSGFGYCLATCPECGFVQKNSETPIEDIYKSVYDHGDYVKKRCISGVISIPERGYVIPFADELATKNGVPIVLEVGPGAGGNLLYLRSRGFQIATLDVSEWNNDYFRSTLNFEAVFANISEIPENTYDGIILTHVIEHVETPIEFLAALSRKLKIGGAILCSTPNVRSLFGRIFGQRWWVYGIDDHVSFFERSTLESCVRDAGFGSISSYSTGGTNTAHSISQFIKQRRVGAKKMDVTSTQTQVEVNPSARKSIGRNVLRLVASIERLLAPLERLGLGYELVTEAKRQC